MLATPTTEATEAQSNKYLKDNKAFQKNKKAFSKQIEKVNPNATPDDFLLLPDRDNRPYKYYNVYAYHENDEVITGKKKVEFAVCTICDKKMYSCSANNGPKDHLRTHATQFKEQYPDEAVTPTPNPFSAGAWDKAKKVVPFEKKILQQLVLKLIIVSDLPFSMVDNSVFRELLAYCNKNAVPQSRRTLMRNIKALCLKRQKELRVYFTSFQSKISITCDVWSSKNQDSFLGISAHWISNEFEQKSCLLAFTDLHKRHTGTDALILIDRVQSGNVRAL
jgi:hypothetical protein